MPTIEKDQAVIAWILSVQEIGLSINLQKFKMKMEKVTQTRPTPF